MAFQLHNAREILKARTDLVITTGVVLRPKQRPVEVKLKVPVMITAGEGVSKHFEKNGILMFRLIRGGHEAGGLLSHASKDFLRDGEVDEQKFMDSAKVAVSDDKKKDITTFLVAGVVSGGIAFFAARNSKYKDKLWLIIAIAFILGGFGVMYFMKKKRGETKPDFKAPDAGASSGEKTEKPETKAESKDEMDKLMSKMREDHKEVTFEDERKFRLLYDSLSAVEKEVARDFISGTLKVATDLIATGEKESKAYSSALGQLEDALKIKFNPSYVDGVMNKFEALDWRKKK
jgi:hypothetical protein